MPIYEYECKDCGHIFDALQKMSDDPLSDCPDCGNPSLRKLLSAPNFRLKGGGWYETDFKDKNQRNLAGDKAGSSDTGGEKSGEKSGDKSGDKVVNKSGDAKADSKAAPAAKPSGDSKPATGSTD